MFHIERDGHHSHYTCISNKVITDKRLSLAARGFFSVVLSLADGWDFSVNGMARLVGVNKDTVLRYIRELEELGYVRIEIRDETGRYARKKYIFYENTAEPDTVPENTAEKNTAPTAEAETSVPKNTAPLDRVPENTAEKNTAPAAEAVPKNTVPKNTVPKNTVPKKTAQTNNNISNTINKKKTNRSIRRMKLICIFWKNR